MIYLCKLDGTILGAMNGLDKSSASLTKNATDFWELTFSVNRYIYEDGELVQSSYYDSINEMMWLYDDTEKMYFIINSEPSINIDGKQEIKNVTANSCELELNYIFLQNYKVNCGTNDSLEYLADNNIDDYTKLPKEYISLVNYENHQLSALHLALENTDWKIADDIPNEICERKYAFDTNDDIYTFLMKTVSPTAKIIFNFDRKNKIISIIDYEKYGEDTGIMVGMRNLLKTVEITSSNSDNIITKIRPYGADNLGIFYVNFGQDYMINYDYFMDAVNEYEDYKYVSKSLHDKYHQWKDYRENDEVSFIVDGIDFSEHRTSGSRRNLYLAMSKEYNKLLLSEDELINRLPNDGCNIDYMTWKYDELKLALTAYNNALDALITLYKDEYDVEEIGSEPDYIPTPNTATSIKNTKYWIDFVSYNQIILKVEQALKQWVQTDKDGHFIFDENGDYIYLETGNPYYYSDTTIVKEIDGWLYEWDLYGLDELNAKLKAWNEKAAILYADGFIKTGTIAVPTSYITDNDWNLLTPDQKSQFTSEEAFKTQLNLYLDYMSFDIRNNSLTKKDSIGVIRQCQNAIVSRETEIESLKSKKEQIQAMRTELANSVILENYTVDSKKVFNENDLSTIKKFIREANYENSNYLVTNLDDIVSTVDKHEELYQDALEYLSKVSQTQYAFSTDIANLYWLDEFKEYKEPFQIGNYIHVNIDMYKDKWIQLRMISETKNPLMPTSELNVEFSTSTVSMNGISDLAFLLGDQINSGGTNSSGGGNSSGGSSGTFGTNDAEIQIANNMLNALLRTETFGTSINDVILDSLKTNKGNFNVLFSHSGIFDDIEIQGDAVIGGLLQSLNYNKNNETGSMINLSDGTFSFGDNAFYATYDNITKKYSLMLKNTLLQSPNYDESKKTGSKLDLTDGSFSFGGGSLKYSPTSGLIISGYATSSDAESKANAAVNLFKDALASSTDTTLISGNHITTGVIQNASKSTVINLDDNTLNMGNGALTYNTKDGLSISGNITASTGSIGNWTIGNSLYTGKESFGDSQSVYLGTNGFSYKDVFKVNNDGIVINNPNRINREYSYGFSFSSGGKVNNSSVRTEMLISGDYVIVWLRNTDDGDKVDLSIRVARDKIQNGSSSWEPSESTKVSRFKIRYNSKTGIRFNCYYDRNSDLAWHVDQDNRISGVYLGSIYTGYWTGSEGIIDGDSNHYYREIERVELYHEDNSLYETYYNPDVILNRNVDNLLIDTRKGIIESSLYTINNNGIIGYSSDFSMYFVDINHSSNNDSPDQTRVILNSSSFMHKGIYNSTSSSNRNLVFDENGYIHRYSSSSKRYKKNITEQIDDSLSPDLLYDLKICEFDYIDGYLSRSDQRHGKKFVNFIAEDIYEKYPLACDLNAAGLPESPNYNLLIAPMLKLIQEQHKDIEFLKNELIELKENKENGH